VTEKCNKDLYRNGSIRSTNMVGPLQRAQHKFRTGTPCNIQQWSKFNVGFGGLQRWWA